MQHSKRKHSDFSASSADRWITCPGSIELIRKLDKTFTKEDSVYAQEGTKAHECLEFIVARFGNLPAAHDAALKKWPQEMVDHAISSAKTIFKLRPSAQAKLLVETRVFLKPIGKDLFGTLDYAWVDEWGTLVVCDYKYGAGVPVLPIDDETGEGNYQLLYYALGLAYKYNFEFGQVKLAVLQPRVWREDEDPLTIGTVTVKALRDFEKKVKKAVALASQPNAPLVPSEKGCRWCPAAPTCPAISKVQMDAANIAFDVEEGITKLPELAALTPTNLHVVLDSCDLLETWIEKVRVHAYELACRGEKIQGRKIVNKKGTRRWLPEAEEQATKRFGKQAFETKLLSPAQLEKALGKNGKSFAEKWAEMYSSGFTLARESDRRPEVTPKTPVFDLDDPGTTVLDL